MNLAERARERLSIDRTSLTIFRLCLSALVLADIAFRFRHSSWLLSPEGLLRTHPEEFGGVLRLLDFDGAHFCLFVVAGCSALLMAFGLTPKWSAVLLFLSMSSIQVRNPWSLDGGDWCLRWLLLWNVLLFWEPKEVAPQSKTEGEFQTFESGACYFSFAGAGLLLQPVLLYTTSVLHKLQGNAWREGTALKAALSQSLWERPLGIFIAGTDPLPAILNYLTLAIEALGPLLLLSPYRPRLCRIWGIALLTLLQLGIGLSLRMNLFPWIMTASLLPFVPGSVWPRRILPSTFALPHLASVVRPKSGRVRFAGWMSQALLFQSLIAAADSVLGGRLLPGFVARTQTTLGLDQSWSMYSPNPYTYDFGIEVKARTSSGESLLLDPGRRPLHSAPQHPFRPLGHLWADYRGGMYLENLANPEWPEELGDFARWVAKEYELEHGDVLLEVSLTAWEWSQHHPENATPTPLLVWRRAASEK